MKRATETRFGPRPLAVLVVAMTALTGCDEALNAGKSSSEAASDDGQTQSNTTELFPEVASGSQRDVEAPDVFEVTEAGLWDGRPSLGGIWVAHPSASQPERVAIKNTSNNKTVTGALFRRERNLPGPALQVSSAAAEKLGMLAGAPARLQVVALRRETIEPESSPEPEAAPTEETADAAEATAAEEVTTAGPDENVEEKPAKRKWWQKKTPENTGAVVAGAAAAGAAASAAAEEAAPAIEEAADASATAALTDPVVAPPPAQKKRKWWQKKDPNEITETPLDPIAGAAAAIDASEPTPAAAASATAASSNLTKPYVQIGTFGVEANAKAAAEKVRTNGLAVEVLELESTGKSVWRVLVGPATTRAERKAILGDMKDLGFTDAFIVKN
uniref:SPOR domain-containing protein n=1 Tax=Ruegeria arenilitoris TaxID=1173585 RepID=UPI00147AFF0F|nr:SPOR domain-containing protein [Ruegeria arenilitoris]